MTHSIPESLQLTRQKLRLFEQRYQRPQESVKLLAVSKTKPIESLHEALASGQTDFGENYLDEALEKINGLQGEGCVWHFIGAIQSNKTAAIAGNFDWVHSIDRPRIAQRLSDQRPPDLPPLNCCIQLNPDRETSKAGIQDEDLDALCKLIEDLPNLKLRGLMSIPAPRDSLESQRTIFRQIAERQKQLSADFKQLDTLSIGMSGDMEAAVAEGSTMVRVGTAIFGARTSSPSTS